MNSKQHLEEFYNYKYWREIQRNQLTISSNIFFGVNIAIMGFTVKYLIDHKIYNPIIQHLFLTSFIFFIISTTLYIALNMLKLKDYRMTAKLIRSNTPYDNIKKKTKCLGEIIWCIFYTQIIFSILGFSLVLFAFYESIFSYS